MSNILVSVIVLTYGQEKYIKQAIDSILMQNTNFEYEIIVGEDCSPDNTRQILKEYETRCSQKFVMLYREKNIGMNENLVDALQRARGKYIAFCEGDDYWLAKDKLQGQVEFLEENSSYVAVAHQCQVVDGLGSNIGDVSYFVCNDDEYSFEHYLKNINPGQTATIVVRNYFSEKYEDLGLLKLADPPDRVLNFLFRSRGKIRIIQKKMSAYRYVTEGLDSWTARSRCNDDFVIRSLEQYRLMMIHAKKYFEFNQEARICIEIRYLFTLFVVHLTDDRMRRWSMLRQGLLLIKYRRIVYLEVMLELVRIAFNKLFAFWGISFRIKRKCC